MKTIAALLALLAATSTFADSAFVDFNLGLIFPQTLGGLQYDRIEKYSNEAFGYSIFYKRARFEAELSVHTLGQSTVPDGHKGEGIQLVNDRVESLLKKQEEGGAISLLKKRGATVIPARGATRFANTVYQFQEPHGEKCVQRIHSVYATGAHGNFFKLNLRFDKVAGKKARVVSQQMIQQLIEIINAEHDQQTLLMAACEVVLQDPSGYGGRTAAQRVLAEAQNHGNLNVYTFLFAWPDSRWSKPQNADLLVAAYFAGMLKIVVPQQLDVGGEYEAFLAMLQAYDAMRAKEEINAIVKLDEWSETADKKTLFAALCEDGLYE